MKTTEEFFVLVAEYKMLGNRIRVMKNRGRDFKDPEMKPLISTYSQLGNVLDDYIKKYYSLLLEKNANAQQEVYNKYNIKMV